MNCRLVATISAVLAFSSQSFGDCRARNVKAQVVVKEVVAVQAVPILVPFAIPVYSVTYQPSQAHPHAMPAKPMPDDLQRLREENEGLRRELQRIGQPQEARAPAGAKHMQIFAKNCASCHDKGAAATKGGGFALLNGDSLEQLTDRQVLKLLSHTSSGTMPKGRPPLSDPEFSELMKWVESVVGQKTPVAKQTEPIGPPKP